MYGSALEQLNKEWENRGWSSDSLSSFHMEMSAADAGASNGDASGSSAGSAGQGSDGFSGPGNQSEYSQMATGFLSRVPGEHRAIIEPYVKQWDAGVTRRFQELQSQIAAYNGYDPETVAQAMNVAAMLEENPWSVYGTLQNALMSGEYGPQPGMQQDQGQLGPPQQQQGVPDPNDPMGQFPEQFRNEWDQMRQVVAMIGQQMLGQNQQQQQAAEQEQLDTYLEGLHNEYGDFDDQWVLLQILNDQSYDNVDKHITAWQEKTNSRNVQQQQALSKLPQLIGSTGGNGIAPLDSTSVKNLSRSDTKNLVASVLEQAARNNQ